MKLNRNGVSTAVAAVAVVIVAVIVAAGAYFAFGTNPGTTTTIVSTTTSTSVSTSTFTSYYGNTSRYQRSRRNIGIPADVGMDVRLPAGIGRPSELRQRRQRSGHCPDHGQYGRFRRERRPVDSGAVRSIAIRHDSTHRTRLRQRRSPCIQPSWNNQRCRVHWGRTGQDIPRHNHPCGTTPPWLP